MIQIVKNNENGNSINPSLGRFKSLGKDNFNTNDPKDVNLFGVIKENSKFLSFSLLDSIKEVFIKFEEAPLYWIYDSPIILYLEDYLKHNNLDEAVNEHYPAVKEFYLKWAVIKIPSEKKYFSSSAIKIVEKYAGTKNFLYNIFLAIIHTFENSLYNPGKALSLFMISEEIINNEKISEDYKDELLYLINVYTGFTYFKDLQYSKAVDSFKRGLSHKPYGITAKFYIALCEIKLENPSIARSLIAEILQYDIARSEYAVDNFSFPMFNYFNTHCIFKNIFYYDDFSILYQDVEQMINDIKNVDKEYFKKLSFKYHALINMNLSSFYDDDINRMMVFMEKYSSVSDKENILFLSSSKFLLRKFEFTLKDIFENIKEFCYKNLKDLLRPYDEKMNSTQEKISEVQKEKEMFKVENKKSLSNAIIDYENKTNAEVEELEYHINNIHLDKNTDPKSSFASIMTYNIIFSSIIFLMGGSAGYTAANMNSFNEVMSNVISTGLKWASLTFVIGAFISVIVAASTVVERTNKKQRLLQRISFLRNNKDKQLERLKQEFEKREKNGLEVLENRINIYKKTIINLKEQRDQQEAESIEEVELNIANKAQHLLPLLNG